MLRGKPARTVHRSSPSINGALCQIQSASRPYHTLPRTSWPPILIRLFNTPLIYLLTPHKGDSSANKNTLVWIYTVRNYPTLRPMNPDSYAETSSRIACLLPLIRNNDEAAADELCQLLTRGISLLIRRRVDAQDINDQVQEVLLEVLSAIKADLVRCPEALAAFARSIAIRKSAAYIGARVKERALTVGPVDELGLRSSCHVAFPEQTYFDKERVEMARRALSCLHPREQEILRRFYVDEQAPEHICLQMKLTPTQFRLLQFRAKARFGTVGKSLLSRRTPQSLRQSPSSAALGVPKSSTAAPLSALTP
jgi:DNA-directed RNA polymerase specialized sigma24 family protein